MRVGTGALIAALVLLAGFLAANGARWYQSSDFFCLYHGGHSLLVGRDPYDETWWGSLMDVQVPMPSFRGGEGPTSCPGRFGYPLWTAVLMLPFAALPLEAGAGLWAAVSIAAVVAGLWLTWRALGGTRALVPVFGAYVVTSPPFALLLISGQPTGIELGLAGAVAYALSRGRSALAGAALAAMTLKPQLAGVTVPVVALRALSRERALLAGLVAALVAMTAAGTAFMPAWPIEWLGEIAGRRLRVTTLLPTAWGLAADVLGNALFGAALIAALVAVLWWILRGRSLSTLDVLVLSLPVSLFATPYAWSYDHLVLAPCWAYLLVRAPSAGASRLLHLLGVALLVVVAPWLLYALAFARGGETLTAVIPAVNAVLVALSSPRAPTTYPARHAHAQRVQPG